MRTALVVIVAASAALIAGAFGMAQFYRPQLQALSAQTRTLQHEVAQLNAREQVDATAIQSRAERAEADYAALLAETQKLREQLAAAQANSAALESTAAAEPSLDDLDAILDAAPAPGGERDRRRNRDDDDSPEREAERAARFQEFRTMVDDFMAAELANATDPATIERLHAMNDARNNLFDLREARRNAATEQEREALDLQMQDARDVMDSLMKEQQQAMLQDVGRQFGIKGENLRAFRAQMREVMESPYFRFGGGGPPGPNRNGPNRRGTP